MFKVVLLTIIVGVTIWTTRADNTKESECREQIERELKEYVKLESWQELFRKHFKFIINKNGEVISEKNRLKANTIIHNAIYGCNHDRDDEVDDCPNIFNGSIKTCKFGRNLRTAMFRTARCSFVESSVKHIVLSDAMLDAQPLDMLDRVTDNVDKPIREFGETVVNMLSTLSHGEQGGLAELMALNLYLNNRFGTVFMHKIPVEPVASSDDFRVAAAHMRTVHGRLLDRLHTFWGAWCSDADVVAQYRHKYKGYAFVALTAEMYGNARESDDLIRGLNVSGSVVDLDFDPKRVALTDFVEQLVARDAMSAELLADMRWRAFEASYEFDPRAVYEFQTSVFRTVYTCFYWTTVTHLKLAVRLLRHNSVADPHGRTAGLLVDIVRYVRPLTVFDINRLHFVSALSPAAAANLIRLHAYLLNVYRGSRRLAARPTDDVLSAVQRFVDLLSADMKTMLDIRVPDDYFDGLSDENALKLMRSNYRAFVRLVSATSGFKEDRMNAIKLKKFMFFLSESVGFDGI